MIHGYVKTAAFSPKIRVADPKYNAQVMIELAKEAAAQKACVMVFPELCITGYTCGDLFWQELLLKEAADQLVTIAKQTAQIDAILFVGLPLEYMEKLYNVAAVLHKGQILGLVPKTFLPNYAEFYEARYFTKGMEKTVPVTLPGGMTVPMGTNQIFVCDSMPQLRIAAELCEDVWAPNPPSIRHALAGADLIVNLSASNEGTGKDIYRRSLITGQSARLVCGYIYASASDGESTQDVVYSGHSMIAENGTLLAQAERFKNEIIFAEIDMQKLVSERRRMSTFEQSGEEHYTVTNFSLPMMQTELTRRIDPDRKSTRLNSSHS